MQIEQMDKIEPGNPFLSDFCNMGTTMGTNCTIMYGTFPSDRLRYLIVVNTETGERIRIKFPEAK